MAEMFKDLDPDTMPRSPGLTYQDLLDQDTHEVPPVLRSVRHLLVTGDEVPVAPARSGYA